MSAGNATKRAVAMVINVSPAAGALLLLALAVFARHKVYSAKSKAALRTIKDAHVWTVPPGIAFPGLFRSASLPKRIHRLASEDTASYRSLPVVLNSIESSYSQIPDHVAAAQRPLPPLPPTYSEIPDDDSGPVSIYNFAVGHSNVVRKPSNQYWPWERRPTLYAATAEHSRFVTQPNIYTHWPSEGIRSTPWRASLPTLPNIYWPLEITGEGTRNTPTRASLPSLTLPNTYWPWEITGEGTRNTPRRASLPSLTLPNTYWPWEIPGKGTYSTPQRVSLPLTLPNTYWPWEISEDGTRNASKRVSFPLVTIPNTYWPWEIPDEGPRNTPRRASLPTVTLPNTYWPWEITGARGPCNTPQLASSSTVTLPNTYWPWEIVGAKGPYNTPQHVSLPLTLPNTYWPWEIPGEGSLHAT
ncbi:PREDICTED: uncharacterized protein LOC109464441 [Branchiostoma belcheri]|uniref:Uncharacterized protein LOC109464441 n=1 Tax=Branchiostoma belcheri TaxID=7741 RepID=A0A6P4Y3J1_BRABE|nr:PREDICTED: uncharacterized protein LOC109464441 [Branchiostoma belcheri]